MWRLLFQMVEGRDLDRLSLELVECIPWNDLAALEGDRHWFSLSTNSSQTATSHMTSSPPPPPPQAQEGAHQADMDLSRDFESSVQTTNQNSSQTATSLGPQITSSPPPPPPQAQEGAQTDMDLSRDFESSVQTNNQHRLPTTATGEEPMDTDPDGEDILTVNNEDARRGKQDLDKNKAGDSVADEQEQQSNHFDEMVPPPDAGVQPSRTSPVKGTKNALKKKRHRSTNDDKNYMPSSEPSPSGETALGRLLAAGESYSMPIDVEAVDMLMRKFPITEEQQVCCTGVDSLNPT